MLTFRRPVSEQVMNLWWELVGLMSDINLSEEDDHIIWLTAHQENIQFNLYMLWLISGRLP
jgi:hypothetical protein